MTKIATVVLSLMLTLALAASVVADDEKEGKKQLAEKPRHSIEGSGGKNQRGRVGTRERTVDLLI